MAAVIQHHFRALITFDPSAPENLMQGYLDGTRTACVIQACFGMYFPAMLACRKPSPPHPAMHVGLSVPLSSGEREAFFAAGRHFIIWADAIVGPTTRGDGLVSRGIISGQEAVLRPVPPTKRAHQRTPHPTPPKACRQPFVTCRLDLYGSSTSDTRYDGSARRA